jgi:hypothetical protein
MAIKQIVPIEITLVGDGASTTFTFPLANMYQNGTGSSLPVGGVGVVPSSILVSNTPVAVTSATIDANGNITITLTTALGNNVQATMEVDLLYTSGAVTSVSPNPAKLVSGVYNSTLPTLTTGQISPIQLSAFGAVHIQGTTGVPTTFTASTVSNSSSIGVGDFNVVTLTLRTFTGTGPSVTWSLQASDDNTNWVTLQGINNSSGLVGSIWTQASALTAGTGGPSCDYTIGAYTNVRIAVTAISGTTPSATFGLGYQSMPYESAPGAICQGVVGAGVAVAGSPVRIGGSDGTLTQDINVTSKGTQGTRGIAVQELKDAGRQYLTFTATAAAGVIAEALLSMSQNLAGTVTAGVSSYVIPNGKTLRIQNASYSVRAAAAAVPFSRMTLRSNTAGATTATSAVVYQFPEVFGISATIGVGGQFAVDIPDGLEIAGNGTLTIGVSHLDQATTNVINFTLTGYLY